jgi:hypothetical protein
LISIIGISVLLFTGCFTFRKAPPKRPPSANMTFAEWTAQVRAFAARRDSSRDVKIRVRQMKSPLVIQ